MFSEVSRQTLLTNVRSDKSVHVRNERSKIRESLEGRIYQSKLREFGRLYKSPKCGQKIWHIFQLTYVRSEKSADVRTYQSATREYGRICKLIQTPWWSQRKYQQSDLSFRWMATVALVSVHCTVLYCTVLTLMYCTVL
jgi:hypothetical protein